MIKKASLQSGVFLIGGFCLKNYVLIMAVASMAPWVFFPRKWISNPSLYQKPICSSTVKQVICNTPFFRAYWNSCHTSDVPIPWWRNCGSTYRDTTQYVLSNGAFMLLGKARITPLICSFSPTAAKPKSSSALLNKCVFLLSFSVYLLIKSAVSSLVIALIWMLCPWFVRILRCMQ